jgi:hypothetical protein
MNLSPHLPEADLNQDASSSSECRFRTSSYWASHAEDDEPHLTFGNDGDGGGSISGYDPNYATAGGTWETPAPQPPQNGDCSMVSVFHQMSSDNHPLILQFHEAKYSIQQL